MKFYIYTLGCKVNAYESEVIKEEFLQSGYELDKKVQMLLLLILVRLLILLIKNLGKWLEDLKKIIMMPF